jgi:hypothetical protein
MPIKTFRGLIASGDQDIVSLHTSDGSTGYRIVKFQLMSQTPMTVESENVVKIYSTNQATAVTATIDFSDNALLASGFIENQPAAKESGSASTVIFDNMIINQDIYVTHSSEQGVAVNYYLELEQIKLDLNENTVATLKDIRNVTDGL